MVLRELCGEVGREEGLPSSVDSLKPALFSKDVRRFQDQAPKAGVVPASRVDDRDRGAVALPDQQGLLDADRPHRLRQELSLIVHVPQSPRQLDRVGEAITQSAVRERAEAGVSRNLAREIAPMVHAAQSLVKKNQRRLLRGARPPPRVLQPMTACLEILHAVYLSLKLWILPVAVFGCESMNSTQRGYLCGASRALAKASSSSTNAAEPWTAGRSTTKAFGLSRLFSSALPTTATSRTLGWEISTDSTSAGQTHWPLALIMSSDRPAYTK